MATRKHISIRTALITAMLFTVVSAGALIGVLGVVNITRDVRHDAQKRVNAHLDTARAQYGRRLELVARHVAQAASEVRLLEGEYGGRLTALRQNLELTVLNVCDASGAPLAGTYGPNTTRVPVERDPVLRRALRGEAARGTVRLPESRLSLEGGPALQNALAVFRAGEDEPAATEALFWWAAEPIRDRSGAVRAVVYGGAAMNLDFDFVDRLRQLLFGTRSYEGKPLGTVTIFMGGTRVATNVLTPERQRAVGTVVSDEVKQRVLGEGEVWRARAWVVDAWYLSAYEPIENPDGTPLGMLYVGLLEAPYNDQRAALIGRLLGMVGIAAVVAGLVAVFLVNYITAPLKRVNKAIAAVTHGDLQQRITLPTPYAEIAGLADSFHEMQEALAQRDRDLQARNEDLAETNDQLAQANRNYMETLGFVTHELKSPLAAMQSMIDLLVKGYVGEIPESAQGPLVRIKRNCEELQDMVKNYLDLSRAERGELAAAKSDIDLHEEVLRPAVDQAQPLFDSRTMGLEVETPETLPVHADPELLRIVFANFLSNAAKYGREEGLARLEAAVENGEVRVSVWNEGPGFTPEEGAQLFGKFVRLQNENTSGKRGSGLGLFLCRHIAELHGGRVWAESEPGEWARFNLSFPQHPET